MSSAFAEAVTDIFAELPDDIGNADIVHALDQCSDEARFRLEAVLKDGVSVYTFETHGSAARRAYDLILAQRCCPVCGTGRLGQIGMGRVFWMDCEPCELRESTRKFEAWQRSTIEVWSAKALDMIGDVHWPVRRQSLKVLDTLVNSSAKDVWGCMLYGKAGTGKTQQAAELMRLVMRDKLSRLAFGSASRFNYKAPPFPSLLFVQEAALIESLKPGGVRTVDQYCNVEWLIIDDIGESKSTDWAYSQLKLIIDSRYRNHRKTLFTSNLSPRQLHQRGLYDERITQRIFEMCGGREAQASGTLAVAEMTTCYRMPDDDGGVW